MRRSEHMRAGAVSFRTQPRLFYIQKKKSRFLSGFFSLVGVTGLEPMASWSRTKRDTKLRHTPMALFRVLWYYNIFRAQNQGLFSKNLKIRKTAVHVPIFSSPVKRGTGACVCRAFRRYGLHCRIYLSAGTDQVQIFRLYYRAASAWKSSFKDAYRFSYKAWYWR